MAHHFRRMTFAKGASLKDPSGLFDSSLEGNARHAIDFHEGDTLAQILEAPRPGGLRVVSAFGREPVADDQRPTGPWLFYPDLGPNPTEKSVQRVYKNALRAMRRTLEAAGLPAYFGLHSLRHTYGSGLISRVSPAYVQQQMGHGCISQTVDTYGSWLPIKVPGAVDTFGESLTEGLFGLGHQMDTFEGQTAVEAV